MVRWGGRWVTLQDGRHVYIESNGTKACVAVSALLIVSALAAGGAGVAGAVTGAAGSVASQSLQARTANGRESARRGEYDETWKRLRLRRLKTNLKQVDHDFRCVLRSTGQVQQFFARNPCRSLRRTLIPLADTNGSTIIVAIAWVQMFDSNGAIRLANLIKAEGTGGIEPLAGTLLGYNGVQFTGQHYTVRRSGDLVVIAEATPWRGQSASMVLDSLASVSAEFPPP